RGGSDAVLPSPRLRDEARLAEPACHQRLADGVVRLVRAGVQEVLALEVDARAAQAVRQPAGEVEPCRSARVVAQPGRELAAEAGVAAELRPGGLELEQRGHERLGDVAAAIHPEVPFAVGLDATRLWR